MLCAQSCAVFMAVHGYAFYQCLHMIIYCGCHPSGNSNSVSLSPVVVTRLRRYGASVTSSCNSCNSEILRSCI